MAREGGGDSQFSVPCVKSNDNFAAEIRFEQRVLKAPFPYYIIHERRLEDDKRPRRRTEIKYRNRQLSHCAMLFIPPHPPSSTLMQLVSCVRFWFTCANPIDLYGEIRTATNKQTNKTNLFDGRFSQTVISERWRWWRLLHCVVLLLLVLGAEHLQSSILLLPAKSCVALEERSIRFLHSMNKREKKNNNK